MLKKLRVVIVCIILSFMNVSHGNVALASDIDYDSTYIKSMDTKITAKDNFTFHVERKVKAYLSNDHGIFLNINYQPGVSRIYNIDVKGPYDHDISLSSESNSKLGIKTIKLGDEDNTHVGFRTWKISYDIKGFKQSNNDKDYLSLSLIPAYFELPIQHAKTTVILPKSVNWSKANILSGHPDSKPDDLRTDSLFTYKTTSKTLEIVGRDLPSKYGVNLQMSLPSGYWTDASSRNNYAYFILSVFVILLIIILICFFKYGRDQKIVEVIEFYPPENMDPMMLGDIVNGEVRDEDIISMFFYFANQGLVEIKNVNKKSSGKPKIEIIKLKNISETAPKYQQELFNAIFKSGKVFKTYKVNQKFIDCLTSVRTGVREARPNLYDKKSKQIQTLALWGIISLIYIIFMGLGFYFGDSVLVMSIFATICSILAYCVAKNCSALQSKKNDLGTNTSLANRVVFIGFSLVLMGFFTSKLHLLINNRLISAICSLLLVVSLVTSELIKKTDKNIVSLLGRIKGFKTFIKTAELDKLNMLVEENPAYFYNILPYAYTFGLTDKWVKHFESIPLQNPEWMVGKMIDGYHTAAFLDVVINTTVEKVTDQIVSENCKTISTSLNSSGGSSNSSGGGFGGGGGGAW